MAVITCALAMSGETDKRDCPKEFGPIQETRVITTHKTIMVVVVNFPTLETIGLQDYSAVLYGMCSQNESNATIVVPFSNKKDKDGKYLPDFEILGHEVWHVFAGKWHDP